MRRSVVGLILCGLVAGLSPLAAAAAEIAGDPARGLVSIHVRDASVPEVIQTVMAQSGANIALNGEVRGTIALSHDNVSVERILEDICRAKGFHWWRNEDGTYFVSTRPRLAPNPRADRVEGIPVEARDKVRRLRNLQFMSPQYVAWLFGFADDPGPEPYLAESGLADVGQVLQSPSASAVSGGPSVGFGELRGAGGGRGGGGGGFGGGGGGRGGGGGGLTGGGGGGGGGAISAGGSAFVDFLPTGVENIVAFPMLNALLIQGTEEGVNEFIDLLKMIDRKPQQIIIELQSVLVSTDLIKQMGIQWYYLSGSWTLEPFGMSTSRSIQIGYTPAGNPNFQATLTYLLETGHGRVVDAIRVATMNLLPATNQVVVSYPWVTVGGVAGGGLGGGGVQTISISYLPITTSLTIVPRINGDGTVTMTIPYQKSAITGTIAVPLADFGSYEAPILTTNQLITTVNVRDGETFVLGGFVNKNVLESERRLPILGDLPLVGDLLFTRRSRTVQEAETLIFITPRVVKEEAAPATLGPI
jgi:type II secretory pathway component GspD/PulD (secretin)